MEKPAEEEVEREKIKQIIDDKYKFLKIQAYFSHREKYIKHVREELNIIRGPLEVIIKIDLIALILLGNPQRADEN